MSASTGLINSPEKTEQGVSITTLLNGKIRPGRLVDVIASENAGRMICQSVVHEGGTEEDQYYSKAELIEI